MEEAEEAEEVEEAEEAEEVEEAEEAEEVEAEEAEEVEEAEEADQPSQPNRLQPPMEMENWRARNPPSSPVIEPEPTSSCTNSSFTNSLTQTPRS